ncbi:MAG: type I-E CRISPR-associated protein Cse2/CasB [Methylocystis sp.]|uniref:type I-E CRISPR-associated protein Cse2/CasB n=1 Tax=Methylocystis sp. TaxID=1911079 RepID=UPI003DA2CC7C
MSNNATQASADSFDRADAAFLWWREMTGAESGKSRSGKDRAALARLRRAAPQEAMTEEATLRLFRALRYKNPARLPRVAALATVLATIRKNDSGQKFARRIGRRNFGDEASAALKPARFRRLLDADTDDEIATAFRRALAIVGEEANVRDVARCLLFFEREETRRRLIFDYYAAGEDDAAQA